MATIATYTPDNLIAGPFPTATQAVTVASGAGLLARGAVLGRVTATGKFVKVNSAAADGSQTPFGVLADTSVDATAQDRPAVIFLTGEFNEDALTFGGADTKETHRDGLHALNIYLRTVQPA